MPQMDKLQNLQRLLATRLVAVLRAERPEPLLDVAEALLEGGVDAIEVTFTVPRAERVIERLADQLGDRILLGAGTVLDSQTARASLLAGASFVVSPIVHLGMIETCLRHGALVAAGALTPTEAVTAWQAGADLVKIFPCDVGGPGYLKALRGPLPQIRLMPTGGIDAHNAADYLRAGAAVLGVGGSLVSAAAIQGGNLADVTARARQFAEIVQRATGEGHSA